MSQNTTLANGVQVNVEQIDRAARDLAAADAKDWKSSDVRNRYRGLALITVRAYLTPIDPVAELLEQR